MGCEVYSVSCDSHFVHKAWADTSKQSVQLLYPMIADPTAKLAEFFGIYQEEVGQSLRGSFIISPKGLIKAYEFHDMGIGRNASELVRKIQAAIFVEEHATLLSKEMETR